MARPQTEDGYTRIANELMEAIIAFQFSKRQLSVLLAVVRQTYGFNRKEAELSLGALSSMTKINKANVSRTLSELEGLGVLAKRSGPNSAVIGINKDYDQWVTDSVSEGLPKQQRCQISNVAKTATGGCQNSNQGVAKTATEGLPNWQLEGCQNSNPYKDSLKDNRKTDLKTIKKCATDTASFDEFWEQWPNKVNKSGAVKAWKKINPSQDLASEILEAIAAQKAWRAERAAAGVWTAEWPHGSTWLNAARWTDELEPVGKNFTTGGPQRAFVPVNKQAALEEQNRAAVAEWLQRSEKDVTGEVIDA